MHKDLITLRNTRGAAHVVAEKAITAFMAVLCSLMVAAAGVGVGEEDVEEEEEAGEVVDVEEAAAEEEAVEESETISVHNASGLTGRIDPS